MNFKHMISAALACVVPLGANAASLTISGFDAEHYHSGGNTGPAYIASTVEDRTDDILITPGGLVLGAASDAYSGPIPNVAGIREGRTKTTSLTYGLVQDDGFFFRSRVETEAECTRKEGVSFGCSPFMGNQAVVSFSFAVDADSTLFLDGDWFGGNGNLSPVSTADFLSVSVRRDNGFGAFFVPFRVDTNLENRNEASGVIEGSIALLAGETYLFDINHRAAAQSEDAVGVLASDVSVLNFAASIVEANADVAAFEARYAAAAPVPLPAAGWMLLAGFGALGLLRRNRG